MTPKESNSQNPTLDQLLFEIDKGTDSPPGTPGKFFYPVLEMLETFEKNGSQVPLIFVTTGLPGSGKTNQIKETIDPLFDALSIEGGQKVTIVHLSWDETEERLKRILAMTSTKDFSANITLIEKEGVFYPEEFIHLVELFQTTPLSEQNFATIAQRVIDQQPQDGQPYGEAFLNLTLLALHDEIDQIRNKHIPFTAIRLDVPIAEVLLGVNPEDPTDNTLVLARRYATELLLKQITSTSSEQVQIVIAHIIRGPWVEPLLIGRHLLLLCKSLHRQYPQEIAEEKILDMANKIAKFFAQPTIGTIEELDQLEGGSMEQVKKAQEQTFQLLADLLVAGKLQVDIPDEILDMMNANNNNSETVNLVKPRHPTIIPEMITEILQKMQREKEQPIDGLIDEPIDLDQDIKYLQWHSIIFDIIKVAELLGEDPYQAISWAGQHLGSSAFIRQTIETINGLKPEIPVSLSIIYNNPPHMMETTNTELQTIIQKFRTEFSQFLEPETRGNRIVDLLPAIKLN